MGLPWVEEGVFIVFMYGLGWKKGNFTLYLERLVLQQVKSWIFLLNSGMRRG